MMENKIIINGKEYHLKVEKNKMEFMLDTGMIKMR